MYENSSKVNYKELALVTPASANALGISADYPTFTSLVERRHRECKTCGVTYAPISYAVGQVTIAHHFHRTHTPYEAGGGGIYFWESTDEQMQDRIITRDPYRWAARVEPIGEMEKHVALLPDSICGSIRSRPRQADSNSR